VIRSHFPGRSARRHRPVQLVLALCFEYMHTACMKSIQVRDVPEETHAVLRQRAAEAGMSLQEYLLSVLNDLASRPTVAEVLARAGGRSGGRVGLRNATALVRRERDKH
jgi:hypothetical protein